MAVGIFGYLIGAASGSKDRFKVFISPDLSVKTFHVPRALRNELNITMHYDADFSTFQCTVVREPRYMADI